MALRRGELGGSEGKRRRGAAAPRGAAPLPPAALNAGLASPAAVASLRCTFDGATPFRHAHVRDVFPDALLVAARDELLAGTYFRKRNDLYDFAQTDDLRRVPPGSATAAVRDALYSPAFRAWVTAVTGVETLPTIDLSAAVYSAGSYLLCHDDDLAGEWRSSFGLRGPGAGEMQPSGGARRGAFSMFEG